ncbi:MAG: SurA N-terminal domain-containing protein [Pyrinomonadaceae bacterium]|nr:SurA N-terminal domain-containing protein [Pyrinomonadaceae bacterium]
MMNIVYLEGVKATVPQFKFKFLTIAILAVSALVFSSCGTDPGSANGQKPVNNETVATVNGKAITMEEVERVVKQQAQGQESKLSPLELAQARLQVLQNLIQTEVMYQKAEKEKVVPEDAKVTEEFNKLKNNSGKSAEEWEKGLKDAGETEESVRNGLKKQLAINALVEKVTSKVEAPKDSEIDAFYKGNPEAFVKKKGVKLSAIIIDPNKSGEGDSTVDEASTKLKINEIANKLNQGADFATVARENSEDQSRVNGGDLGYISEDQLKQGYGGQLAAFMNPQIPIGKVVGPINLDGKFYIFKLVERSDKDENLTLESPGVRQQIIEALTNGRKDLVSQAYAAQAMNEAKIENLLLKKIVDNPNELSGARPAATPNANANTNANTNAAGANSNANANKPANANAKPEAKPTANTAANTAPKANTANTKK